MTDNDLNDIEIVFIMSMFALARPHIPKEDLEKADKAMDKIIDKLGGNIDKTPFLDGLLIGLKMQDAVEKEEVGSK